MIEVGEYVRTKRGIAKVLEVKTVKTKMYGKHDVAYLIDKCPRMYITETEFIKHSKNIIDLIEVGDYVNENRVYKITSACIYFVGKAAQNKLTINIETILTKEQYEANCYTVEKEEER